MPTYPKPALNSINTWTELNTFTDGLKSTTTPSQPTDVVNLAYLSGGGGGVTSIGLFDSQTPSANGLSIALSELYAQSASLVNPGMVNNIAQEFIGQKTFTSNTVLSTACVSVPSVYALSAMTIGGGNTNFQPCLTLYNYEPITNSAQLAMYPNSISANDSFVIQPMRFGVDAAGTLSLCPSTGKVSVGALPGTSTFNVGTTNQFQVNSIGFFGYSSSSSAPTYNMHIVDSATNDYLGFIDNTSATSNAGALQLQSIGAANTLNITNAGTGYGASINCTSTGFAFRVQNSGATKLYVDNNGLVGIKTAPISTNALSLSSGTSVTDSAIMAVCDSAVSGSPQLNLYPTANTSGAPYALQVRRSGLDSISRLTLMPAGGYVQIGSTTATTALFNAGSTNQFQINTLGNVGIGAAAGNNPLTVVTSNNDFALYLTNNSTFGSSGGIYAKVVGGSTGIYLDSSVTAYGQGMVINGNVSLNNSLLIQNVGVSVFRVLYNGATSIGSSSVTSLFNVGTTNQFQVDSSGNASTSGSLTLNGVGKTLGIAVGTGGMTGDTAAMVAGTVTVSCTTLTVNHRVQYSRLSSGGTIGDVSIVSTAGVGFTLTSNSATETSIFTYVIFLRV